MSHRAPDGYVDPNFADPGKSGDAPVIIYGYLPSLALAVIAVVLFALSSVLHGIQLFRYRTWYFAPFLVGTVMEVVGYICRSLSSKVDPYLVLYFVLQYFFIVVAPVFFSASIYTILSVLITRVGREYAPLPPRVILGVFIACDVVATIVQIFGAASIGVHESRRESPVSSNNILLGGLAFQVLSFFVFIVLTAMFLWRARAVLGRPEEKSEGPPPAAAERRGVSKGFLAAFLTATVMVYLRTCFRLAETANGVGGKLSSHEVYFGCLEFAPIVIAVSVLNIWHPGRCVPTRARLDRPEAS